MDKRTAGQLTCASRAKNAAFFVPDVVRGIDSRQRWQIIMLGSLTSTKTLCDVYMFYFCFSFLPLLLLLLLLLFYLCSVDVSVWNKLDWLIDWLQPPAAYGEFHVIFIAGVSENVRKNSHRYRRCADIIVVHYPCGSVMAWCQRVLVYCSTRSIVSSSDEKKLNLFTTGHRVTVARKPIGYVRRLGR